MGVGLGGGRIVDPLSLWRLGLLFYFIRLGSILEKRGRGREGGKRWFELDGGERSLPHFLWGNSGAIV